MQLFITPFEHSWNELCITNPEVLHQTVNVLRYTSWTKVRVQEEMPNPTRYELEITDIQKKQLRGRVMDSVQAPVVSRSMHMAIAMPNKLPKLELIVQKLAEIGVNQITIRPSQRSQLRDLSQAKIERLQVISREAVEQSRWRTVPDLRFVKKLPQPGTEDVVIIFDEPWEQKRQWASVSVSSYVGIIWPEGGFSPDERQFFAEQSFRSISLWDTILRMETAAIVGAWYLKHIL